MSEPNDRSWDDAVAALRQAAKELQIALGHITSNAEDSEPSASRLKRDLDRLLQAGGDLQSKFIDGFAGQRLEVGSNLDRDRAEKTARQLKSSVEELATLAIDVATEVAAAAQSSLKQAEPELRTAARSLEDLASSAADWIANSIESGRSGAGSRRKPPLDEL